MILIGDAARTMLLTQVQGASQAVRGEEALGAFYLFPSEIKDRPASDKVFSLVQADFNVDITSFSHTEIQSNKTM